MTDSTPNTLPNGSTTPNSCCVHVPLCGGCTSQHVPYETQLQAKTERLRDLFSDCVPEEIINQLDVVPSPHIWRYRNKMEFTFKPLEGPQRLSLGLHLSGEYDRLVDLEMCWICPEVFTEILTAVREFARRSGYPAYHSTEFTGFWRFLQIRSSNATGKVLVEIFTKYAEERLAHELAELLTSTFDAIQSVWWSLTPGKADAALPEESRLMAGEPFIVERIGKVEIEVGPRTFVQPNVPLATTLYSDLLHALEPESTDVLWDLYCGSGSIGLFLAPHVRQVFGIERSQDNVAGACRAANRNGIATFTVVRGNLDKVFRGSQWMPPEGVEMPQLVVTDPPRAGLHPRVLRHVAEFGARRWAYIACRPESLRRDIQKLLALQAPYRIAWMRAYDLFPHTRHVETVIGFQKIA